MSKTHELKLSTELFEEFDRSATKYKHLVLPMPTEMYVGDRVILRAFCKKQQSYMMWGMLFFEEPKREFEWIDCLKEDCDILKGTVLDLENGSVSIELDDYI